MLYSEYPDGTPWRFTSLDPTPRRIERRPDFLAQDGSLQVYDEHGYELWASADGGLTWQYRPLPGGREMNSLTMASADARVLFTTPRPLSATRAPSPSAS